MKLEFTTLAGSPRDEQQDETGEKFSPWSLVVEGATYGGPLAGNSDDNLQPKFVRDAWGGFAPLALGQIDHPCFR